MLAVLSSEHPKSVQRDIVYPLHLKLRLITFLVFTNINTYITFSIINQVEEETL